MDERSFVGFAKTIVADYARDHLDKGDSVDVNEDDVYVVWMAKILQNNKAMLSTTMPDGMYYEVTYNGDKDEFYLDAYKKFSNEVVDVNV